MSEGEGAAEDVFQSTTGMRQHDYSSTVATKMSAASRALQAIGGDALAGARRRC